MDQKYAALEKADYTLMTSSGIAALVLLFSGFSSGSRIVVVRDLYGGRFRWFNEQEATGRFQFSYAHSEKALLAQITDETDDVFIATPTNPLLEEFDITKVSEHAHNHGAKLFVDNTFYSPIYQNSLSLGADVVLHSATKYLLGHNDVLVSADD